MEWIVTEVFFPDEVSTAQIMTDIAQKKISKGDVSIICGPMGYEKSYRQLDNPLDEKITIYRVNIPDLNKNKISSRVLRLFLLTFKMGWLILTKIKKDDNVLLVTNPAFLVILAALIKRMRGFHLSILVHDVFPENLIPAGIMKRGSAKFTFLSKLYNFSYRQADELIVLGEDMKALMHTKLNKGKIPLIKVITNWADPDLEPIDNFDKSNYFSLDLQGKVVLGFAGNLGRLQGLIEFVRLFNEASNPYLSLVIVGDGALKNELMHEIDANEIQNVHLIGPKPRNEQAQFLNACDIGLITLHEGMKGLGVPSKTYNLLAVAKPLLYIGDKGSEIDSYISMFDFGWSYSWNERNEIIAFLNSISPASFEAIKSKGINALRASVENYSKDTVLNEYIN